MKYLQRKSMLAISAAAMAFGLAACDRADNPTVDSADSASTRTERAANEMERDTRSATAEARRDARDATASADRSMDRAAESTRSMGAAGADTTREMGAAAGDKTREMGAATADKVDDATITTKVNAALAADSDLSAIRIDVDTKDGVVTLSGPAPNATAKEKASQLARDVKGVTSVNNQLTVSAG